MRRKFLLMTFLIAIIGFCGTNLSAANTGVAKVGNTEYATIDEAIAAWTNNTALTLLADVTLSDVIQLSSTEYHILDLGTYTMTAASGKDAIHYVVNGRSSASYALDIKADAVNPGGITAEGKTIVSHIKPSSNAPSKDRPITRFYGGVFNASYVVKQGGNGLFLPGAGYTGASAPYFQFYGGVFNGTIYLNRSQTQFHGGVFNGSIQMSVDSSAYGLVAGGTFKNLSNSMGSALNSDKFAIGSAKGVYDKDVYIDDNGNTVIAAKKPEQGEDGIQADVPKTPGTNDYLYYSKVKTEEKLGYTDVYTALEKNTTATVTVYVEELDLKDSNFKGTIVVPEGNDITITNIPKDANGNFTVEVLVGGEACTPSEDGTFTTIVPDYSGEGTETSPYIIASIDDLSKLRDKVNNGETYDGVYFRLESNITLTGEWTPIGNGSRSSKTYTGNSFKGVFDGNNNIISGLTITSTTGDDVAIGLFGVVDGGTVKNLNLTDVNINVPNSDLAGAAIGMMLNGATADKITVSGAIVGHDGVGGIVGRLIIDGTISNCINNASVTSAYGGIGGIVGKPYYEDGANTSTFAYITDCINNGTVTAPMYIGGIAGLARANFTGCTNNGAVVGGTQTGGIVGQLIAAGTVSGNENKAKISGKNHLGGIIGDYSQSSAYTYYNVSIANNINRGELAATEQCAAIMGCNNIDGFTAMTATGNVSYYYVEGLELFGNPEDMVIDETNKFIIPVAQVGEQTFYTFAEAAAAAQAGDEIKLLANIESDITVPANVTLNGNGFAISGGIFAEGDITFAGVTTAVDFDANVANTAVNIPAGASLQLTGTARLVIGHGATFNITGTIEDAKTADKATLVPSLKIAAGASITGNGVTFNVNNAYIVAEKYCSSKNSNANGTFNFNINNSIWDQTGNLQFSAPTNSMDPTVNFNLANSVLTTTSHVIFSVTKGEVVIDNSKVNEGVYRQLENRSTMTVKNGSVVNGAVATSENAKNPGTIIVENATYAVTGEFSGSDLGTGTLIIKKGANVSVGSIEAGANVVVDAEGMAAGDEINFTADLSKFTGTLSVINNDNLEAKIVDGKIVLVVKPVAKIGDVEYATLQEAIDACEGENNLITLLNDITFESDLSDAAKGYFNIADGKKVVLDMNGKTINVTDKSTGNFIVFYNYGEFTVANGTINLNSTNDRDWNAESAIFLNRGGIFNIENGTYTHNGGTDMAFVVDNSGNYYGDATTNIYEKTLQRNTVTTKLTSSYIAIRNRMEQNSHGASGEAILNVYGGTISGTSRAIWAQAASTSETAPATGEINVKGGNIGLIDTPRSTGAVSMTTISGGEVSAFKGEAGELTVTGGTLNEVTLLTAAGETVNDYVVNEDGLYVQAVAKVGETKYATLAEAVEAAQSGATITLLNGEHELPLFAGKELTFKGESKEGVIVNDAPAATTQGWLGSTFHFENLTAKGATENYHGLANGVVAVTYKDCNINGLRFLYSPTTFTNCAFNANGIEHSFWTYGASNVTVNNCTFTYTDRAVNCYSENDPEHELVITFEGCSFTYAGTNDAPEGAVEINSSSVKSIKLVMNGCTAPEKGAMWFNSQWDSADGLKTVVVVDGVVVWTAPAKIGETRYATLQAAIAAAQDGEEIDLLKDVELTSPLLLTKNNILDGNGFKLTPAEDFTYDGNNAVIVLAANMSGYEANRTYTVKNLTIEGFSTPSRIVRANFCDATIQNCIFDNNTSESIITSAYAVLNVEDNTFTNNTTSFAVINVGSDVSDGTNLVAKIIDNKFYDNKAATAGIFLASSADVTGNHFKDNTHTGDNANAAAILAGPYTGNRAYTVNINSNAFENAMSKGGTALPSVFAEDWSANYGSTTSFDLSLNYWDGNEPVAGTAYKTSGDNPQVTVKSYYRTYEEETKTLGGLVEYPSSTLTNAYTSATGYWGECGGNAKESFVFKFYNNDTYMGYTSLNNVNGIINGEVYVSWHIKLNTESNEDEYWTMAWDIQPTVAMQPNRVEHWVDGVKVKEVAVEPNWSDRIFPVVAAITDENGVILSYVNGTTGATLADAFAKDANITILRDINLTEGIVIPTGKTITLDLNGYTVSQEKAQTTGYGMITNVGTLTIKDNSNPSTGKLSYKDTGNGGEFTSSTIQNHGHLTILGGRIENLSSTTVATSGYPHAIDHGNYSKVYTVGDVTLDIQGGTISNAHYSAIRMFCNSATYRCDAIISGGTIENAIDFQLPNAGKLLGSLTITGGTFNNINGKTTSVRMFAAGNADDGTGMIASIEGGTFNGTVGGISQLPVPASFNTKVVKGGMFSEAAMNGTTGEYLAPGFVFAGEANAEGYYTVVDDPNNDYISTLEELIAFRDAVNAGNTYEGVTVYLTEDIDLNNEEWTPIAYMGKTFKGTFDGNGKTIKNLKITKTLENASANNNIGFFGRTDSPATIENITIENVDITGSLYVGAIVGLGYTGKHVKGCTVKGNIAIDAWWYAGVIGGNGYMNLVDDCHVIGNNGSYIKGNDGSYIGGIWGFRGEGNNKITNCTVTNLNIIGVDRVGGICGIGHYGNTISGCDAEDVTVTATDPEATTIGLLVGATQGNNISGEGPTIFEDNDASGITAQIDNGDGTYTEVTNLYGTNINGSTPVTNYVAQIVGGTQYATLAEAVAAAVNNDVITLLPTPTDASIAMNASLYGKNVTITGTATVDWSKGFLFVGRGGEGNAKLTFESANLTSASNSSSYGIHVSGREKNTNNKYDGTLVINNSTIDLDYLINKGTMTLDESTLTVKNGFSIGGRPASETESGEDATATITLNNNSRVVVNNHNGMGLGYEAIGIMNINSGSTFECTQNFLVTAKGTMNVNGGNVKVDGTLTNNGEDAINVNEGESTLNITTLTGKSINLNEGAIVKNSTVGGAAYVAGNVLFRGDNTFAMITDYGDYYSSTTPSMWTVEAGASLTLTKTDRYGLGYGDKVTVYGEIEDALTARESLTDADASVNMYGGLVGMTNSASPDANNVFKAEDAYLIFGVNGDKSFGNKSGDYYGNYDIDFTNCVVTANGFKFYEDKGNSDVYFNNSDLLVNGVLMTNDASSKFTFENSVVLSKATSNGTDDKNQNAGVLTLVNTTMTYSAAFTNVGNLNIGENSTFTAPEVVNNGTINFTAPSAILVAQEGLAINLALDNPEYYEIEYADGAYSVKQVIFEQTQTLSSGWNWFSSYINLNSNEGLETLQNALGTNGIEIKSHYDGYVRYESAYELWWGNLSAVAADQMYMIRTSTQVDDMKLVGEMVDYNNVSITLKPGWNWIGFPMSEAVSVTDALAGFEAKPGDQIKSKVSGNASYDADMWYGGLNTLVPGEGYMYYNSSSETRSFTYNVGTVTKGELKANVTTDGNHWIPNAGQYPNNMTMTAMVEVEGGDYEVAAFVNGECRGSARPIYIEAMDAHILFLTIHGEDVEEMTFRYYDLATGEEFDLNDRMNYSNDAIVGTLAEPYIFSRGTTGIGEASLSEVNIYPNPTTTGTEINLQATCDKVEVFNALGVKVAEYHNVDSIDAFETAGIYVIRLTSNGDVKHCRLIVK